MNYPTSIRVDHTDDYHGTTIADPYRWLEDENAPRTRDWVSAQNELTFGILNSIPEREAIRRRLSQLWDYERYSPPVKHGRRLFMFKNDGLQNQSVLYTLPSLESEPVLLLDPNELSSDGTVALAGYEISDDGDQLAYGLSTAGSDWEEWRVRDVRTGKDLPDVLRWVKFSGASWSKDGSGFYYSRFDEPPAQTTLQSLNYHQKLYYHRLGTPQSDDALIYHRPNEKEWGFAGRVTEDGHYLVITISQGTDPNNRVFYQDLRSPHGPVIELLNAFDASYTYIGNEGPLFWVLTNLDAPRGRVIAINLDRPERAQWKEVIPQNSKTLTAASLVNHQFICNYLADAHSEVDIFDVRGSLVREVLLPQLGTAFGFEGKPHHTETFFAFASYTTPGTVYRYDLVSGAATIFREPTVAFKPQDYRTSQVFVRSKDGTRVPMFITHRTDIRLTGDAPTYLYGYGGFNISLTPSFSPALLVWMEMGGVLAVPNLRGGGEYGEEWHQAGIKDKKQNVFDDFIAAAEWLIEHHYTCPSRLAIGGGSNGGLLVGAAMTQRPELFGAALPAVGVMDMLRFHKFTIGWAWTSDYGSPDNPDEFKAIYAYSPYHHLREGTQYPATLITTADHDDRVVPMHSFKFAAALQHAQAGPSPALIRIETRAGHGAGKPTSKLIEEATDRWAFLVKVLNFHPTIP